MLDIDTFTADIPVISASLSISIASGALMLRACRLAHLSVCPESVLWQNGRLYPTGPLRRALLKLL